MRGRVMLLALTGLLAVGVPTAGAAFTRDVAAANLRFTLQRMIAVTGDSVRWTNNDAMTVHSVTQIFQEDLVFGTPQIKLFNTPGTFAYHCRFHPGMIGTVSVYDLYFAGPSAAVLYGRTAAMTGYAPEGSTVDINKIGGLANPVATPVVNASTGKFTASILAVPGQYEAVTTSPAHMSSPVRVNVKPKLAVTKRHSGRTFWITVKATPNQSGATMVLERRKGFGWKKLASHNLGAASKTVFKVVTATKISVRLRLSAPVGGYAKTTSSTLTLRP
jgi:plastocyanin